MILKVSSNLDDSAICNSLESAVIANRQIFDDVEELSVCNEIGLLKAKN